MQENQEQQIFTMDITAGIYAYKYRQENLDDAQHLGDQGKNLFQKKLTSE